MRVATLDLSMGMHFEIWCIERIGLVRMCCDTGCTVLGMLWSYLVSFKPEIGA